MRPRGVQLKLSRPVLEHRTIQARFLLMSYRAFFCRLSLCRVCALPPFGVRLFRQPPLCVTTCICAHLCGSSCNFVPPENKKPRKNAWGNEGWHATIITGRHSDYRFRFPKHSYAVRVLHFMPPYSTHQLGCRPVDTSSYYMFRSPFSEEKCTCIKNG